MIYTPAALLLLAAGVNAQCMASSGAQIVLTSLSQLKTDAQQVQTDVNAFSASQGLAGALAIQQDSNNLLAVLQNVTSQISALGQANECDSTAISNNLIGIAPSVVNSLSAIVAKQSDFTQVSAAPIVQTDLGSLQNATNWLESAVYGALACDEVGNVFNSFDQINSGFGNADAAYTVSSAAAPAQPLTCAPSSAPASSVPASSAPASSAPASSAPASSTPGSSVQVLQQRLLQQ